LCLVVCYAVIGVGLLRSGGPARPP